MIFKVKFCEHCEQDITKVKNGFFYIGLPCIQKNDIKVKLCEHCEQETRFLVNQSVTRMQCTRSLNSI